MNEKSYMTDLKKIPENWPTNLMEPQFWEELGRCIATFSCLEGILARAFFALSGTRRHEKVTDEMMNNWYSN